MAILSNVGSRPIAKQKMTAWMAGKRKTNKNILEQSKINCNEVSRLVELQKWSTDVEEHPQRLRR